MGRFHDVYHYDAGFDVLTEEHGGVVKTMVGGLGEAIGTSSSLGTYRYFTHDHLGSVREVRDESAGLTAEFAYGPYGESYFAQEASFGLGPSDLNHINRRFTGHQYDPRGGNYWTPFRTYSPTTARWLTPDPLGMVDGPNMYAYVGGSPVNFVDPLGLNLSGSGYELNGFLSPVGMGPGISGAAGAQVVLDDDWNIGIYFYWGVGPGVGSTGGGAFTTVSVYPDCKLPQLNQGGTVAFGGSGGLPVYGIPVAVQGDRLIGAKGGSNNAPSGYQGGIGLAVPGAEAHMQLGTGKAYYFNVKKTFAGVKNWIVQTGSNLWDGFWGKD